MQRITPNIWCRGTAAETGRFYASVFPDAASTVTVRYPDTGLPDFQQRFAGKELVVDVAIAGYRLRLINAGDEFRPGPAISFIVNVDPGRFGGDARARGALDAMWTALSDGGEVRMALDAYPHSPRYGWVEDRYGVNWQLMLTDPDGDDRPFLTPQLLFTGSSPRAAEAMRTYTGLLTPSRTGLVVPGAEPDAVMYADFTLADQWFSVMDGGAQHAFGFTPGVSLQVDCTDQAEIDRLWVALSAVPEAEQCGWLVDRFGVSWQIVPSAMAELMQRPDAYAHMMAMKKLVIDEF